MLTVRIGIMFGIILITFGISSAKIYKWVDENGVTHYSDSPTSDQMPEKPKSENNPAADDAPAATPEKSLPDQQPKNRNELMESIAKMLEEADPPEELKAPAVELYVTDWCPYCKLAEKYFESKGIDYVLYNVSKDGNAKARLQSITDYDGVPFAVVNGIQIEGYSVMAYRRALKSAEAK